MKFDTIYNFVTKFRIAWLRWLDLLLNYTKTEHAFQALDSQWSSGYSARISIQCVSIETVVLIGIQWIEHNQRSGGCTIANRLGSILSSEIKSDLHSFEWRWRSLLIRGNQLQSWGLRKTIGEYLHFRSIATAASVRRKVGTESSWTKFVWIFIV